MRGTQINGGYVWCTTKGGGRGESKKSGTRTDCGTTLVTVMGTRDVMKYISEFRAPTRVFLLEIIYNLQEIMVV